MDVLSAIDSFSERKRRLRTAFSALECRRHAAILSGSGANWNDVEVYLDEVEKRLRASLEDAISKEMSFEEKARGAKEALDEREAEISRREQASLALVQEKKDTAVASILEAKRKWNNEQQRDEEEVEDDEKGKKKGRKEMEKMKQNEKQIPTEKESGKQQREQDEEDDKSSVTREVLKEEHKKKEKDEERENLNQKQNEKEIDERSHINKKDLNVEEVELAHKDTERERRKDGQAEEDCEKEKEVLKVEGVKYDDENCAQMIRRDEKQRKEEEEGVNEEKKEATTAVEEVLKAKSNDVNPNERSIASAQNHLGLDLGATHDAEKLSFEDKRPSLSGLLMKETNHTSGNEVLKPRPMLKSLCEAMDSEKLRNFIAEQRKDLISIRAELPLALRYTPHPAVLVLKALDGYHLPLEAQSSSSGPKKEASSLSVANKRACVILMESLADVMKDRDKVSEDLKKSARRIADSWKSKINLEVELTSSNQAIEAQSFLQLLATFGMASEYDPDELCKLVIPITRRRQTPALCRVLGLSSKVPDIIEKLIKDAKQIEAIGFAAEFELLDRFPPVPLLKTYLKDSRKVVLNTPKGQNDATQKELSSLKTVLKIINDLKLEEKYPPTALEKRIAQLEKEKADKKRTAGTARPQQMKRPRTNVNFGYASRDSAQDKSFYQGRVAYGKSILPYDTPTPHSGYDCRLVTGYGSTYGGGMARRSPVSMQSSYMYPSDAIASLGYGTSSYTTSNAPYSGYGYGSGLPSGYQSYH